MRAAGSSAPATMPSSAIAAESPKSAATLNPRWTSRSDRIGFLQDRLGGGCLVEQNFERGQVGIPFEEGRPWADALDRRAVERPHRRRDARAVRIDQTRSARIETGEMN